MKKRLGLVWEEQGEQLLDKLRRGVAVLKEVESKAIVTEPGQTVNLLIEGDNLISLHALLATHRRGIDIIYIDPPYNRGGGDFVYDARQAGQQDGYRHSKWLSFMNRRLRLARELLKETGLIFISIDDREYARLKLLCDEIFGEANFLGNLIRRDSPKKQRQGKPNLKSEFEYCLVYARSENFKLRYVSKSSYEEYRRRCLRLYELLVASGAKAPELAFNRLVAGEFVDEVRSNPEIYKILIDIFRLQGEDKGLAFYKYIDEGGVFASDNLSMTLGRGHHYKIANPFNPSKFLKNPKHGLPDPAVFLSTGLFKRRGDGNLGFAKPEQVREIEPGMYCYGDIIFKEDAVIRYKKYLDPVGVPDSILMNFQGSDARLLESMGIDFEYPKRVDFVKFLLSLVDNKDAVVLDFFAGSGTTGHAVLELNREDGGRRTFILCETAESQELQGKSPARLITHQRLKKAMQGYQSETSGAFVPGLGGNLRFYQAEIADRGLESLLASAGGLIQIKERAFTRVYTSDEYEVYENGAKVVMLFKLLRRWDDELEPVVSRYLKRGRPLILYGVGYDDYRRYNVTYRDCIKALAPYGDIV